MLSVYKTHYNPLYNKLIELSRNIFFYKKILLKDNFETRINLIFIHMSLILIVFKEKKEKEFPQEAFDNIFLNIEYHIRELGYGDVVVNKKMKILTRIFYDLVPQSINIKQLIDNLAIYFKDFYYFCFELRNNNMLKGEINFKY